MNVRIGQGFDLHRLEPGDAIVLGGVSIPAQFQARAHSDGDVLLHALCDALLGAAGRGDIGDHFPDSDPRWRDADSRIFVRHCRALLEEDGWQPLNVDLTLLAETPRIGDHKEQMRRNLAVDLQLEASRINIKAGTMEGLGAIGRGEAVAALAAALIGKTP